MLVSWCSGVKTRCPLHPMTIIVGVHARCVCGRGRRGVWWASRPEACSGLPVSLYDAVALSAELGEGFERVDEAREVHATPWGSDQAFTWVLCRRGAS